MPVAPTGRHSRTTAQVTALPTLDTYSHVVPGLQEEAADRLDAVLGGKKK